MPENYTSQVMGYLKKIDAALDKKASKDLRSFTKNFYQKMPITELQYLLPEDAGVVVEEAYKFAGQRKAKQIKMDLSESKTGKIALHIVRIAEDCGAGLYANRHLHSHSPCAELSMCAPISNAFMTGEVHG